ncbi:MAG: FeoB-associated Cys-rich membrane protein [Campylobacter sp.]|nr:FeoB-associated Cys-rich membrane protein [Campylobacter sp.]
MEYLVLLAAVAASVYFLYHKFAKKGGCGCGCGKKDKNKEAL